MHLQFRYLLSILFLSALVLGVAPVHADDEMTDGATINVTTTADEYDTSGSGTGCSLREAVTAANTNAAFGGCNAGKGKDKIVLQAATYLLMRPGLDANNESGDLDIKSNLTLQGAGQTTTIINGNDLDGVIFISGAKSVVINDLTVTNGTTGTSGGGINAQNKLTLNRVTVSNNHATFYGGGIAASGTGESVGLFMTDSIVENNTSGLGGAGIYAYVPAAIVSSTIRSNTTQNSGSLGGGINNNGNGNLLIRNSTISNNTAEGHGGGLHNTAAATLVNTTISGNNAKGDGGGIANGSTGTLSLLSVTIANNHADSNNNNTGLGGGIWSHDCGSGCNKVKLKNTLVANNTLKTALPTNNDCEGPLSSGGFNLIENVPGTCDIGGSTGNIITGQDPSLGILGPNGGPTYTHPLASNSIAIDRGAPAGCEDETGKLLATDQRGELRSTDGDGIGGPVCEIGAYEHPIAAGCTAKPATPQADFPIDGSTNSGHKTTLKWKNADCAEKFKIILKRDSPQGSIVQVFKNVRVLEVTKGKLSYDTYYWRVIGINTFGKTKSAWYSFTLAPK